MSFKLEIMDDPGAVALRAADLIARRAAEAQARNSRFTLVLSGGSTPVQMHRILAKEPFLSRMPWENTHVFWVDERYVEADDPSSNYGAAMKDLLNHVRVPQGQVHFMGGYGCAAAAAKEYSKKIKSFFRTKNGILPAFDLMVLGMGADGHIASLFPGHDALHERRKMIVAVKGGNPYVERISMTLPLINNAGRLLFMVTGEKKARTVRSVITKRDMSLPASMARGDGGVTWLLDSDAASLISRP